jgi:exopolysaccharide production protein ExoQ
MPRQFVLLLCTVFVLFLLRIDRKQAPNVSRALWIPTIWMLLIASKPLAVWFPWAAGGSEEAGSPLDRLVLIILLCLGLILLVQRKFDWSSVIKKNIWLILLIAYMFVSILWSEIPFTSFKRWTRELIAVILAFLVLTERNPRQAMESIFRRTVYILIPFSLLLIKYFPEYGRQYHRWSGELMWVGVTTQKNGLGRLCLFAASFLIWTLIRRWQGRCIPVARYQTHANVFVLIITLLLLKGPGIVGMSATAVTALATGLAFFFGLLLMKKYKMYPRSNTLLMIIGAVIIFGTVTVFAGGATVAAFTSTLGRDVTLTGRTEIWAALIPYLIQNPILGGGFGGFWIPTIQQEVRIGEAHNGYLDVLLELGFFGLLLVSMFLLSSCRMAHRELKRDFDWASFYICFLLMALVHNISESSLNSLTSHMTAVIMFLTVSFTAATSCTSRFSR